VICFNFLFSPFSRFFLFSSNRIKNGNDDARGSGLRERSRCVPSISFVEGDNHHHHRHHRRSMRRDFSERRRDEREEEY